MQKLKRYALVVAGGLGTRVGGSVPKQFAEVHGMPVLFHTLSKFNGIADDIIVVLPPSHIILWENTCKSHNIGIAHRITAGGDTRSASVKTGLALIHEDCVVAIHDAVRPFVSAALINNAFAEAEKMGCAIPALHVTDSLRKKQGDSSIRVNRDDYCIVQTPQCFRFSEIRDAYETAGSSDFTDDAGVFEHAGYKVHLIEGEYFNRKITYPDDLRIAELLLQSQA